MTFTIIDYGDQSYCANCRDLPDMAEYNPGAVIKCDRCGQKWFYSKFRLWEKTNWEPSRRY